MVRLTVVVTGAMALLGPCAAIPTTPGAIADRVRQGNEIRIHMQEAADRNCNGLASRQTSLDEEKGIGGAIAIGMAQKAQGAFFVDGLKNKDPVALQKAVDAEHAGKAKDPSAHLGESDRNNLNRYLATVGRNLAGYTARPTIGWTFGVLDDATPNAFSAPGGYVFVTTGLLKMVENESQLAGVLAHEIGHVSGRHALKTYGQIKENQCRVANQAAVAVREGAEDLVPDARRAMSYAEYFSNGKADINKAGAELIGKLTDGVVDSITTNGLAKDDEYEADKTAFDLLVFAGYNPAEYQKFLGKIPDGGGWTAHHPSNKERIDALDKHKAADFAGFDMPAKAAPLGAEMKVLGNKA